MTCTILKRWQSASSASRKAEFSEFPVLNLSFLCSLWIWKCFCFCILPLIRFKPRLLSFFFRFVRAFSFTVLFVYFLYFFFNLFSLFCFVLSAACFCLCFCNSQLWHMYVVFAFDSLLFYFFAFFFAFTLTFRLLICCTSFSLALLNFIYGTHTRKKFLDLCNNRLLDPVSRYRYQIPIPDLPVILKNARGSQHTHAHTPHTIHTHSHTDTRSSGRSENV